MTDGARHRREGAVGPTTGACEAVLEGHTQQGDCPRRAARRPARTPWRAGRAGGGAGGGGGGAGGGRGGCSPRGGHLPARGHRPRPTCPSPRHQRRPSEGSSKGVRHRSEGAKAALEADATAAAPVAAAAGAEQRRCHTLTVKRHASSHNLCPPSCGRPPVRRGGHNAREMEEVPGLPCLQQCA